MQRSARAAPASIDPEASTLEADVCDRSLHALTLALKLPEARPATNPPTSCPYGVRPKRVMRLVGASL